MYRSDGSKTIIKREADDRMLGTETNFINNDDFFKVEKSSSSCHVDDIIGFVYGAQTSRFWMLRKYLISMPQEKEN